MKILFCHTGLSTFVKSDLDFLKLHYDVTEYAYTVEKGKVMKIRNIFSSLFFSLKHVRRVDIVYGWFGGFHCFWAVLLAKILHKKSIIIVGGYDASYIPSIRYGVFYNKGMLLWCVKKIYQWATYICPVDESLVRSTNYYADPTGKGYKTGILNHMELEESKIKVIPTGYDSNFFKRNLNEKIFDVVASGYVGDENNFQRKGFDLILQVASKLPNLRFAIIGVSNALIENLKTALPPNIYIQDFVSQHKLVDYFSRAHIFLQISIAEGLPNTLCEAMLCECVPIGSSVNGIPDAIGDSGFLLRSRDVNKLEEIILKALSNSNNLGIEARKRVIEMFPISKRRNLLMEIINYP